MNSGQDITVGSLDFLSESTLSGGRSMFVKTIGKIINTSFVAGQDANVMSYDEIDLATVNAHRNAYVGAVGDLKADVTAGGDVSIISFGAMDATVDAATIGKVWSQGDLTGTYHAGTIDEVISYGSIDATISATSLGGVQALGDVDGTITATEQIAIVSAGGEVGATLTAADIAEMIAHDASWFTSLPTLPLELTGATTAAVENAYRDLIAAKEELQAAVLEMTKELAASEADIRKTLGDLQSALAQSATAMTTSLAKAQVQAKVDINQSEADAFQSLDADRVAVEAALRKIAGQVDALREQMTGRFKEPDQRRGHAKTTVRDSAARRRRSAEGGGRNRKTGTPALPRTNEVQGGFPCRSLCRPCVTSSSNAF